jgi:hypothetical protein
MRLGDDRDEQRAPAAVRWIGLLSSQAAREARDAVHTDSYEWERKSCWNDPQELQDQRRIEHILGETCPGRLPIPRQTKGRLEGDLEVAGGTKGLAYMQDIGATVSMLMGYMRDQRDPLSCLEASPIPSRAGPNFQGTCQHLKGFLTGEMDMSGNGGRSWWNEVFNHQLVFPSVLDGALEDEAFAINGILDRFTNMCHTGPPKEMPDSAPFNTAEEQAG